MYHLYTQMPRIEMFISVINPKADTTAVTPR